MSSFSEEQIAELKALLSESAPAAAPAPEPTPEQVAQDRVSVVGKPDVDPEAGPEFYVHLADGQVVRSFDSSSTHVDGQLVIGRYAVGE